MVKKGFLYILFCLYAIGCTSNTSSKNIVIGAENMDYYLPLIEGKNIAVVANQSSLVNGIHLVDTLISLEIHLKRIFSPEHGFRGNADRGELIKNSIDQKTGLPVVSLYGKDKGPSKDQLVGIETILFDLQDVGARFFTYMSTLHCVMDSCSKYGVKVMVLDRPNPNGHYVDGPVLDTNFSSFVGMYPVPIVHGMTIGELASLALGEGWVCKNKTLQFKVVPCLNYTHNTPYSLPIKPSPNLTNDRAVMLYPSLCLFEGTPVSVGRGTDVPFQVYGHPKFKGHDTVFIPKSMPGAMRKIKKNEACFGYTLTKVEKVEKLELSYLLNAYHQFKDKASFFNDYFTLLAGTDQLQAAIEAGRSEEEIRASWKNAIDKYREIRANYLIYAETEP